MTRLEPVTTQTGSDKGLGIQCSLATQTIPPTFRSPHGPLTSEMSEHTLNDIHEGSIDHNNRTVSSKGLEYQVGHCWSLRTCNETHDQFQCTKMKSTAY